MSAAFPSTSVFSAESPTSRENIPSERTFQTTEDETLFARDELRQFSAEDAEAGRRIAKILAALFIYTLIAMSVVTWWTFRTVEH